MSKELLDAMTDVQCNCSLRERESGHRTECWMPALREAVNALQADAQRKDEALRGKLDGAKEADTEQYLAEVGRGIGALVPVYEGEGS